MAVLLAAAGMPPTFAQNAPQETPVIRSTTQEVLLDLIVRDKKGRVIRDLRADEVEILDGGAPVKINNWSLRTAARSTDKPGEASDLERRVAALDPMREIRLVTLLFEGLSIEGSQLARNAALDLIKTADGPNILFAVLQVGHRLRPIQPYTMDRVLLKKAIEKATLVGKRDSGDEAEISSMQNQLRNMAKVGQDRERILMGDLSGLRETAPMGGGSFDGAAVQMARLMLNILRTAETVSRELRGRPSVMSLLALAQEQAALPGRKTVIYFSEGLHLNENLKPQFRRVIGAANRANVSIYTIDASGLATTNRQQAAAAMMAAAMQSSMDQATQGASAVVRTDQVKAMDTAIESLNANTLSPLAELAGNTGGFVVADANDLRGPLRRIFEDITSQYEASYTPGIENWDGSFRPIEVKVNRPGVRVQARTGYFALPGGERSGLQAFEMPMLRALAKPPLEKTFAFRAAGVPFRPGKEMSSGAIVIEVPLDGIALKEDETAKLYRMHLSVLALVKNASGQVVAKLSQDVPYQASIERVTEAKAGHFVFEKRFDAPPGQYTAEIAVMDRAGERLSSEQIAFDLPAAKPGVALSAISALRRVEPLLDGGSDDLFRFQNARGVPTLTGCLSGDKSRPVNLLFTIYPGAGVTEPVSVELEVMRRDRSLGRSQTELELKGEAELPYIASLPGDALSPGPYQVIARAHHGDSTAEQRIAFTFECGKPEETVAPAPAQEAAASGEQETPATGESDAIREIRAVALTEAHTAPDAPELKRIIEGMRANAVQYTGGLPDFVCLQRTDRFIDGAGLGIWKRRDTIEEALRYENGSESYIPLSKDPAVVKKSRLGIRSRGEFGTLLKAIFRPESEARIEWKDWVMLEGERVMLLRYSVAKEKSAYSVTWTNSNKPGVTQCTPAIHGEVYVDEATLHIRRITLEADSLPPKFPLQESGLEVNYNYVRIGERDYLLPTFAVLRLREGRRRLIRNEISFDNYHKFISQSTIRYEF